MGSVKMIQIARPKETASISGGKGSARTSSVLVGVLLILAGCDPLREAPPPAGQVPKPPAQTSRDAERDGSAGGTASPTENGKRLPDGSGITVAALRRDRDRLKREVGRLRGERARWNTERRVTEDFLADFFRALDKEDYPQALTSINQFLRTHPGHPLSRRLAGLRPAVEKLQSVAAEREALRDEIRKLKDIQIRFDDIRKEGG